MSHLESSLPFANVVAEPFVFPSNRFPTFDPPSDPPLPPEEFGPPLSFNPHGDAYQTHETHSQNVGFEFIPLPHEVAAKKMDIFYNVVENCFHRGNSHNEKGWKESCWRTCNVIEKREDDWKMMYLARMDSEQGRRANALLEYRFNLGREGLKVKSLQLRLPYKTYRDGKVRVHVCSKNDHTTLLDTQELRPIRRANGWNDFIVRVELSGKESSVAEQNAQLFRQPIEQQPVNADWKFPFRVIIEME